MEGLAILIGRRVLSTVTEKKKMGADGGRLRKLMVEKKRFLNK